MDTSSDSSSDTSTNPGEMSQTGDMPQTDEMPKLKGPDYMSIDSIIDKVAKLPITDREKADILESLKQNMLNPSRGETEDLNRIQSKYIGQGSPRGQPGLYPPINYPPIQGPRALANYQASPIDMGMGVPMSMYYNQGGSPMTTAHFEILKNKLDSVQLELVDLLRHVKDYTQRYMNAVRQADMEKIDAYVNGLFQVDKKMQEAKEQAAKLEAAAAAEAAPPEEEPQDRKSIISRATDGIKNFFGGLGDNVSGITNIVSNTATMANNLLSRPILGSDETSNTSAQVASSGNGTGNGTGNTKRSGNIMSVDEYVSNMNQLEQSNNTLGNSGNPDNIIRSNANNFNVGNTAGQGKEQEPERNSSKNKGGDDELADAIDSLNAKMNEDINNTVQEGVKMENTGSSQAGGGWSNGIQNKRSSRKTRLAARIQLLKMKLTKQRLESELKGGGHSKTHKKSIGNISKRLTRQK